MTHFSGVNIRQPTYDAIIKKTFTEIQDRPSRRQKDNLLVEVEMVLVGVSVPLSTGQVGLAFSRKQEEDLQMKNYLANPTCTLQMKNLPKSTQIFKRSGKMRKKKEKGGNRICTKLHVTLD